MKLYIIGGTAGSGKSTLGKHLKEQLNKYGHKACIMQLTWPLYNYAKNYFNWDGNIDNKPRQFLQTMGIEIIKKKLHKDYFLINRLSEDIEILSSFFDTFIITDARLIIEIEELKKRYKNTITIHVKRELYNNKLNQSERTHITETELLNYDKFDYTINNYENTDLEKEAINIIKKEETEDKYE